MTAISQLDGRRLWQYCFGGVLCCLLLVYAMGAKLALYHLQQPGARSVAATKAWQDPAPSIDVAVVAVDATPSVFAVVSALLSLVLVTVWCIAPDEPVRVVAHWFSPYLSIRPPPTY